MSISTYTDVWCDVCGTWEDRATAKSGREARRNARALGWKIGLPGGLDVCPSCVSKGLTPTVALGDPEWEETSDASA